MWLDHIIICHSVCVNCDLGHLKAKHCHSLILILLFEMNALKSMTSKQQCINLFISLLSLDSFWPFGVKLVL